MIEFELLDPMTMPDLVLTRTGQPSTRQPVTSDNILWLLEGMKVKPRWNVMDQGMILEHPGFTSEPDTQQAAEMVIEDMALRMNMQNLQRVREIVEVAAKMDPFHPFEDYLMGLTWDGRDRLGDLAATVTTSNALWPVYLRRWLVQVCEAACGWREKARPLPHVLTFAGPQGIGKGTWFSNLFSRTEGVFAADAQLHLDRASAKDDQLAVLRCLVAELSEIDTTFRRSDVGALKAFLSRPVDNLRAPYARKAVPRRRNTVFCGSVNNMDFLMDSTGSRRFWPVMVERIAWDHGIGFAQVWAQAYDLWCEGEAFVLTRDEDAARIVESDTFQHEPSEAEAVYNYFDEARMARPMETWLPVTRNEVAKLVGVKGNLSPAGGSNVNAAMEKLFGPRRARLMGKRRAWMVPIDVAEARLGDVRILDKYLSGVTVEEPE